MKKRFKPLYALCALLLAPGMLLAKNNVFSDQSVREPLAIVMIIIALSLLPLIYLLAKGTLLSYRVYTKKKGAKAAATAIALMLSAPAFAQEAVVATDTASDGLIGGLSTPAFWFLASVIVLELIVVAFLGRTYVLFNRLQKSIQADGTPAPVQEKKRNWFERLNNIKSVDARSEAEMNLGHDYDGIEELDNPTPPWWQWGFIISAVFAVVYMWVYHVGKTSPLQLEELAIANEKAEKQLEAYLSRAGNNVDENTVTLLTESADLTEGKEIFVAACAACHAPDGGGTVGPNLTDPYWLHGGSVNDVFKTIKYGVPEKGMKSWKDDYSPKQIARIASYILSLQGTKPADPKEPQGEIYESPQEKEAANAPETSEES